MSKNNIKYDTHLDNTSQSTRYFSAIPTKTLDMLTKHQKDMLLISDLSGNVLFVSESIEQTLGYDKEQYFGTGWKATVSEELQEYITSKVKQNIQGDLFSINYLHANGKQMLLKCIIDQLSFDENNQKFYVLTIEDITSKREVEEFMIRAEKMSVAGQLAAGIAHEIRNPLTAIKGFLQLLQSGIGNKDAYFKVMIDEIEKINRITSELLYLSKPITDSFQKHSLHEIVSDIITLFQAQATQKEIKLRNKINKETVLHCDQLQIKQVFINLIKNALEEMEVSGEVIIIDTVLENFLQIDVIDEGNGITEEDIIKVKDPFFTTKEEGTGLGLVITNQIIDRHKGRFEVFTNEKTGSTFRIHLPIID